MKRTTDDDDNYSGAKLKKRDDKQIAVELKDALQNRDGEKISTSFQESREAAKLLTPDVYEKLLPPVLGTCFLEEIKGFLKYLIREVIIPINIKTSYDAIGECGEFNEINTLLGFAFRWDDKDLANFFLERGAEFGQNEAFQLFLTGFNSLKVIEERGIDIEKIYDTIQQDILNYIDLCSAQGEETFTKVDLESNETELLLFSNKVKTFPDVIRFPIIEKYYNLEAQYKQQGKIFPPTVYSRGSDQDNEVESLSGDSLDDSSSDNS